ncbi:hypothetical protein DESC_590083 [Desulfosarcina cetonica]|nr:hypothetical protein DESC_590083 [Desulfosarcina cetonica]
MAGGIAQQFRVRLPGRGPGHAGQIPRRPKSSDQFCHHAHGLSGWHFFPFGASSAMGPKGIIDSAIDPCIPCDSQYGLWRKSRVAGLCLTDGSGIGVFLAGVRDREQGAGLIIDIKDEDEKRNYRVGVSYTF